MFILNQTILVLKIMIITNHYVLTFCIFLSLHYFLTRSSNRTHHAHIMNEIMSLILVENIIRLSTKYPVATGFSVLRAGHEEICRICITKLARTMAPNSVPYKYDKVMEIARVLYYIQLITLSSPLITHRNSLLTKMHKPLSL